MMQRMMSRSFEEHLETLRLLCGDERTMDRFITGYCEVLGELREDLNSANSVEEVLVVIGKGKRLKNLLTDEVKFFLGIHAAALKEMNEDA
jgi:hypothetical protein